MPHNETFRAEPVIGAVPRLRGGAGGQDWSAKSADERPRRLSFRVPGRTMARPHGPATPDGTMPAGLATATPPANETAIAPGEPRQTGVRAPAARSLPAGPGVRVMLDAWHESLDGTPAAPPPGEHPSRFTRIEHARAASIAVQVPEAMRPSQIAYHAVFLDHEYAVAASYAQARAGEPGLTCNEWIRRNPFVPAGPEAARDA